MTLDVKAIRRALELQEKATPAEAYEWDRNVPDPLGMTPQPTMYLAHVTIKADSDGQPGAEDDLEFIAHAHITTDQLCACVELLKKCRDVLDRVTTALGHADHYYHDATDNVKEYAHPEWTKETKKARVLLAELEALP